MRRSLDNNSIYLSGLTVFLRWTRRLQSFPRVLIVSVKKRMFVIVFSDGAGFVTENSSTKGPSHAAEAFSSYPSNSSKNLGNAKAARPAVFDEFSNAALRFGSREPRRVRHDRCIRRNFDSSIRASIGRELVIFGEVWKRHCERVTQRPRVLGGDYLTIVRRIVLRVLATRVILLPVRGL